MPTKLSERNLLIGIALFATACTLIFCAKLIKAPVQMSEKGIGFIVIGIIAALFAVKYLKKAIVKI
jgi:hypothetical protein